MTPAPFNTTDEFYAWITRTFHASKESAAAAAERLQMPAPVHFGSVRLTGESEQDAAGVTGSITMWAPTRSLGDFAELVGWLEHGLMVHAGMGVPERKPRTTIRDSKGRFARP